MDFICYCPACEKAIFDRDLAIKHLKSHHPWQFINCYRCPICGTFQPGPDAARLCCSEKWSGEVCMTCHGFKFQMGGGPCPDCNGTGMAEPGAKNAPHHPYSPSAMTACPACKCSKYERLGGLVFRKCPRCKGVGKIPLPKPVVNPRDPHPLPW